MSDGHTPITLAIKHNAPLETIWILLDLGADKTVQYGRYWGLVIRSPVTLAENRSDKELLTRMLQVLQRSLILLTLLSATQLERIGSRSALYQLAIPLEIVFGD